MAINNPFGNNDSQRFQNAKVDKFGMLASWIMPRVERAREHRDDTYQKRWDEYYRLWRGFWDPQDKNRTSERSKIIAPATSQAIDMSVAEIEEATFGRAAWFDFEDELADEQPEDVALVRNNLLEDMELANVPDGLSKSFLLAAIYGTGIAKCIVTEDKVARAVRDATGRASSGSETRILVRWEAIDPNEFVIDPVARSVNQALFCAHEMTKPLHVIELKQKAGVYRDDIKVSGWDGEDKTNQRQNDINGREQEFDGVWITEYYGKVPRKLLQPNPSDVDDTDLVEAIVTIANKGQVLKAVENPFTMKDRPVVAFQWEEVPDSFWGRGICEKGYNAQKALDAELRARIDVMALTAAPMMGVDTTRMPRNPDMTIRPGKVWALRGRPSEVMEPVGLGQVNPQTFQASSDFERMVQVGTGAMDSASPLNMNRRNETASGMSMLLSGFVKRSKRTLQNIERQFLEPILRKTSWRYMQFEPSRYPKDHRFTVQTAMGLAAREFEQGQLIQLLNSMEPSSPAYNVIMQSVVELSGLPNKEEIKQALAQAAQPDPQAQQMQQMIQQLQMENAQLENEKLKGEIQKLGADAGQSVAKTRHIAVQTDLEDDKVAIMAAQTAVGAEKIRAQDRQTQASLQKERSKSTNGQSN